jgi:acyl dehydratase
MTVAVSSVAELPTAVGASAMGAWFPITQQRIVAFAEATEDRQWIHVDAERAAAGPFGGTIAHGYLTLSLLPRLTEGLLEVGDAGMVINYGLDRVRFLQPVPAGARVRALVRVASALETPQGMRVGMETTVEIEGQTKPALVAETVALFFASS